MKNLLFILLGTAILTYSCSNGSENDQVEETVNEETETQILEDVDVNTFSKLIENQDGQLLDVRTPEEWAEGIISHEAIKINFYDDDFENQVGELDKEKPVLVYCKSGGRSSNAAEQMNEMGFTTVYNLDGGITAWKDAGKNTEK